MLAKVKYWLKAKVLTEAEGKVEYRPGISFLTRGRDLWIELRSGTGQVTSFPLAIHAAYRKARSVASGSSLFDDLRDWFNRYGHGLSHEAQSVFIAILRKYDWKEE